MEIGPFGGGLAAQRTPANHLQTGLFSKKLARGDGEGLTNDTVLHDFLRHSQPWAAERVPLPRGLRWALWALIPIELFWTIWLATIVTGSTSCRGPICTVATLDHHAAVLLTCGVFCVAVLAGLIPSTRGFSKCNGKEVLGLTSGTAAGGASLLGIGALIIGASIALAVLAIFVITFTAASRREMDDARPRTPFPIAPIRGANSSRAHRAERSHQAEVAEPPRSTLVGVDGDSAGLY
jgi:hypothetical protein